MYSLCISIPYTPHVPCRLYGMVHMCMWWRHCRFPLIANETYHQAIWADTDQLFVKNSHSAYRAGTVHGGTHTEWTHHREWVHSLTYTEPWQKCNISYTMDYTWSGTSTHILIDVVCHYCTCSLWRYSWGVLDQRGSVVHTHNWKVCGRWEQVDSTQIAYQYEQKPMQMLLNWTHCDSSVTWHLAQTMHVIMAEKCARISNH